MKTKISIMTNEQLLDIAKNKYPVGTKFRIAHIPDEIRTVKSHDKHKYMFYEAVYGKLHLNFLTEEGQVPQEYEDDSASASVYSTVYGWAEVVEYTQLPKAFTIEYVKDNPLWDKYIKWLQPNLIGNAWRFYGRVDVNKPFCDGESTAFKETILTLEQWDRVVNGEPIANTKKEIVGYKLKEECEKYKEASLAITQSKLFSNRDDYDFQVNSGNYYKLKKAQVLDLWFEPVYKNSFDFKVGDYIWVGGDMVQITEIIKDDNFDFDYWINHTPNASTGGGFGYKSYEDVVSKATPEEIEIVNLRINDYKIELHQNGIKVGCEKLTWQQVIDYVGRTEKAGYMRQLTMKEQRTLYQLQTYASKHLKEL